MPGSFTSTAHERPVHFGRDIIALRRETDVLEFLHRLDRGHAGGRVDIAAGQLDVESFSTDQLPVSDASGGIALDGDYTLADCELIERHAEALRSHLEQYAARLGRDTPPPHPTP